ncbi:MULTISPECIES: hypothetical protein [unclassified Arcicella]|uniref:hypothetical protein n=1 Tax=unclassified Arcicella TaxID=2644986 RepID=UPI002859DC80|nr:MULTISPECIES: hypothetical protein [unclassified Arcicella]MDR6813025.1 hypothetical protein [Arcicella sp. BE140]MDR6824339.1 hypothetical protein [Arcicella sp. BE139]
MSFLAFGCQPSAIGIINNNKKALQTLKFEELFYLGFRTLAFGLQPSDISNQLLKMKITKADS